MGRTHAASGAVVYLMAVPLLGLVGVQTDPVSVLAGAVAASGAAMLPDLDHPQASISRSLWPVTYLTAMAVGLVSGGHRQATHSLLGLAVGVGVAVGFSWSGGVLLGLYLSFLGALALAAFRIQLVRKPTPHTILCLLIGVVLTTTTLWRPPSVAAIAAAVGLGVAAHIAGDCLTREGCPLLWPLSTRRLALLGLRTDSTIERLVLGPGLALSALWLAWHLVNMPALAAELIAVADGFRPRV